MCDCCTDHFFEFIFASDNENNKMPKYISNRSKDERMLVTFILLQKFNFHEWSWKAKYKSVFEDGFIVLFLIWREFQQTWIFRLNSDVSGVSLVPTAAYLNTGIILMNRGHTDEAKRTFLTCADIPDENLKDPHAHKTSVTSCLYNLGKLLHEHGHQEVTAQEKSHLSAHHVW